MRWMVLFFSFFPFFLPAASIRGTVTDAITLEPLGRVAIEILETGERRVTDAQGNFSLTVSPGTFTLVVSSVDYRASRHTVEMGTEAEVVLDVRLDPVTLRHSDSVTVTAGAFATEAPLSVALAGSELKNLASVLADDPIRAVQALPGVTSNDDFRSQIALRGAGYNRIGFYLDGILLHAPFHSVQGEATSGSLSLVQGDLLASLGLFQGALPPKFSDRTAGAVDAQMRDGQRKRWSNSLSASLSNFAYLSEGRLGKGDRGSWMAAFRKSYLQYLLNSISDVDNRSLAFGFTDVQGRLTYDLGTRHTVRLSGMQGHSGLDRAESASQFGINTVVTSGYDVSLVTLGLRSAITSSLNINQQVAWMRESYTNLNRTDAPLAGSQYGEWIYSAGAAWGTRQAGLIEFGGSVRRLRDDGYRNQYVFNPAAVRAIDRYRGSGLRPGVYGQYLKTAANGRVTLGAGGRWDTLTTGSVSAVSPYASLGWRITNSTGFEMAWGQSIQFPEISILYSTFGRTTLLAERATHAQASLEQRLGEKTRLRFEVYQRSDRDLLAKPFSEPRIVSGRIVPAQAQARYENSQRGRSRGMQVFLQRRTASGFTGWVAYSYGKSWVQDGLLNTSFVSDFDPSHAVQAYSAYRLTPSITLSLRYIFGTGLPAPGFFRGTEPNFFLSDRRNELRLYDYHRADARINKVFQKDRWRLTLFAEVVNLTNRRNVRFDSFNGYDPRTGAVRLSFDRMFPILPSAGVLAEF